jgi:hypothetical protein
MHEWHAVHLALQRTPRMMSFDFGVAGYAIPLRLRSADMT